MSTLVFCNPSEKDVVKELGSRIGFGRLMQLSQECWEDMLKERGEVRGGSFAYGPCLAAVVPCKCQERGEIHCDWCEGSQHVTRRVRALQDEK